MRRFQTWRSAVDVFTKEASISRERVTIQHIRHRLAHLVNEFDGKNPFKLTAKQYQSWLSRMKRTYSPATVARSHGDAIRLMRWMGHPMAETLALIRVVIPETAIRTLSKDQLKRVIEWVLSDHESDQDVRLAAYIAIISSSGMRAGECCALEWADFNFEDLTIRLTKTKTRVSRWAAILPLVAPAVIRWRERGVSRYVIPNLHLTDQPLTSARMRLEVARLREILDIPEMTSKMFRSTMVKMIIERGGTYENAAAVVGHASIETTRKHYHRIAMNQQAKNAQNRAWEDM